MTPKQDVLADNTARLKELERAKTERDPAVHDQLVAQTPRFLDDREANDAAGKRIAPRYQFESVIVIRFSRGVHNYSVRGWARDLSESELGALLAEQLVIGEHVTLSIVLTSTQKEKIPAQVMRQVGTQYGFQFTALSFKQRMIIQSAFVGRAPCVAF